MRCLIPSILISYSFLNLNRASALPSPSAANSGAVVVQKPSLPALQKSSSVENRFGFLDDNGAGVARLVQTTTTTTSGGDGKEVSETSNAKSDPDLDNTEQHQLSWKDSQRRGKNYHIKASIMTILLLALCSPFASHNMLLVGGDRIPLQMFRAVVTFLYLLECALSSTRKYLSNSLSPDDLKEYLQQIKQAPPTIQWLVECYHYRSVRQRNSQGHYSVTNREKIVTHRARKNFDIDQWRDVTETNTLERAVTMGSGNDNLLTSSTSEPTTFLKTTLAKLFVFTNPDVGQRYFQEETLFKEMEGRYDVEHVFQRTLHIDNFRHKILVVRTGLSDIAFASPLWFWIASFCGMTVPYRIWFSKHCRQAELTITKQIDG